MNLIEVILDLKCAKYYNLSLILDYIQCHLKCIHKVNSVSADLIDIELLNEIRGLISFGNTPVYFGKTLRDLKCFVQDSNGLRQHEIFIKYKAPKKMAITSVKLPHSPVLDQDFSSLKEIINACTNLVNDLSCYFFELEKIERFCTVMEPINPSFKDDYRRILLDDRTWLHVEITPDGLATNIHLIGHSDMWHDKLQAGLLNWDHDKDIVENIMSVFDLLNFPLPVRKSPFLMEEDEPIIDKPVCGICLCSEIPDEPGVPQPLCQNTLCGVHFHRNCLFQWLVACAGSRPPPFGVATGTCPTCLLPIACSDKDN